MCSAQSTFFYGVFVKTAYLCFASDAYKEVKDSLLAVDMISQRKRKGSLVTKDSNSCIATVPEEVWKMIKAEIAGREVLHSEVYVANEFDDDCSAYEDEEEDWQGWKHALMRHHGLENFYDRGGMEGLIEKRLKVTRLLRPLLTDLLD